MTAPRSTKLEHTYQRRRRLERASDNECPFCSLDQHSEQFIEETPSFLVIRNIAPYSVWDGQGVSDHLMIVPKLHTDKLGDLDDKAAIEYLRLVDAYEGRGYNLFARAPRSKNKSVVHQHTHLILPNDKHTRFFFYVRKPFYVRISR